MIKNIIMCKRVIFTSSRQHGTWRPLHMRTQPKRTRRALPTCARAQERAIGWRTAAGGALLVFSMLELRAKRQAQCTAAL